MFLLHCKNCGGTYSVKETRETRCECEETAGILKAEKVVISGDPYVIIVDDNQLSDAIYQQQIEPKQVVITTVLLPFNDENVLNSTE